MNFGICEECSKTSEKSSNFNDLGYMIDDWFPDADGWKRVSAFGSDREHVTAHRHPDTKHDVYSIIQQAEELTALIQTDKKIPDNTMGKIYYLAAMLVCGGMRQIGEEK